MREIIELKIDGMHCGGCALTVQDALELVQALHRPRWIVKPDRRQYIMRGKSRHRKAF
jgi:copper chaperone CopZ